MVNQFFVLNLPFLLDGNQVQPHKYSFVANEGNTTTASSSSDQSEK